MTTPAAFPNTDCAHIPGDGTAHHSWNHTLCSRLTRMRWAADAQRLLAETGPLPDDAALFLLPTWNWVTPKVHVGRKNRTSSGAPALLPAFATTGGPTLRLLSGHSATIPWTATGLGTETFGTFILTRAAAPAATRTDSSNNTHLQAEALTAGRLQATLERLVAQGHACRWEIMTDLERHAWYAAVSAHKAIASELAGGVADPPAILDRIDIDHIRDTLMLGDSASTRRKPSVPRIIDRCLKEETFRNVDPQMYIRRALRRDAEQTIRVHIGDPRVGPRVRAIQRELGTSNIGDIVDLYRQRHPYDRLAERRAVEAILTTAASGTAATPVAELAVFIDDSEKHIAWA